MFQLHYRDALDYSGQYAFDSTAVAYGHDGIANLTEFIPLPEPVCHVNSGDFQFKRRQDLDFFRAPIGLVCEVDGEVELVYQFPLPLNFGSFYADCLEISVARTEVATPPEILATLYHAAAADVAIDAADLTPATEDIWEIFALAPGDTYLRAEWLTLVIKVTAVAGEAVELSNLTLAYRSGRGNVVGASIVAAPGAGEAVPTGEGEESGGTGGGGPPLSDADPLPIAAVADPGVSTEASRADHVHPGAPVEASMTEVLANVERVHVVRSKSDADVTTTNTTGIFIDEGDLEVFVTAPAAEDLVVDVDISGTLADEDSGFFTDDAQAGIGVDDGVGGAVAIRWGGSVYSQSLGAAMWVPFSLSGKFTIPAGETRRFNPMLRSSTGTEARAKIDAGRPFTIQVEYLEKTYIEVVEDVDASGGGAPLSDEDPLPLAAVADPGVSTEASRADHVHPLDGLASETYVDGAVAAHEALADPHAGYQKESEKGAAGGYASLDGTTLVPVAQLPDATTLAKGIVKLAGDLAGTAALPVIAPLAVTDAKVAAANKDGTVATPSMRTIGTGAQQAAAGDTSPAAILTTKGDLLGRTTTGPSRVPVSGSDGKVLTEDSSDAEGVAWAYASAFPGSISFGLGSDGSSTLVADTVITDWSGNFPCLYFTTLNLSTFTLTTTSSDLRWRIYCSVELTANGGEIFAQFYATGGVVTGGAASGGGGKGGDSGLRGSFLQVYAKEITGTGTISCNGQAAQNGANATVATTTGNGAQGTVGTNTCTFRSVLVTGGSATQGGGGVGTGAGGAAGGGGSSSTEQNLALMRNPQQWFVECEFVNSPTTGYMNTLGGEPDGSAAGGRNTGAQGAGGGGSGGGSLAYFGTNAAGSAGASGTAGAAGAGGGAGGGGGSGGLLTVVALKCPSTWLFRANGGAGGAGGNGFGNGGGGAGGPGGGGGWVRVALGRGSGTPTIQANGGLGGNLGTGGTGGAAGNPGGAGLPELYAL